MSRRIVQLSVIQVVLEEPSSVGRVTTASLYALCDDGTVWEKPGHYGWTRVESIPQDGAV